MRKILSIKEQKEHPPATGLIELCIVEFLTERVPCNPAGYRNTYRVRIIVL